MVSFTCYMRHIQLKHLWICWKVKVLHELEKIISHSGRSSIDVQVAYPVWNSLGCCLNHYATASCTSSHMNLQPLSVMFQKCENCMVASPRCDALW